MGKTINQWITGAVFVLFILGAIPLFAQEVPTGSGGSSEKESSVSAGVSLVSNYVWRGYDVLQSYQDQQGKAYGSFNTPWAIQPDITVETPVEGLSFNLWGSFAINGRQDADSDGRLQMSPGGANLLTADLGDGSAPIVTTGGVDPNMATRLVNYYQGILADPTTGITGAGVDGYFSNYNYSGGVPSYYKEANGTKRGDEIDVTMSYVTEHSSGSYTFGVVAYLYGAPSSMGSDAATELFVSYSPPVLSDLSLTGYFDIQSSNQYYSLGYGKEIEISDSFGIGLSTAAGYGVTNSVQGMMDVTASLEFLFGNFSLGLHGAYRPNTAFFDTDTAPGWLPVWVEGGSNQADGMIADPSRTDVVSELVASTIGTNMAALSPLGSYTYTHRQKIPKTLGWISAGYSVEF